ncbi:MAG TPA: hypothetical protein VLM11_17865, partial [Streptosporangiaceae bacterium]|nr:hypothetical protein [Streptosporangiaceae bacterium]
MRRFLHSGGQVTRAALAAASQHRAAPARRATAPACGSASAQPATLLAECDLGTALDKAVSQNNDVLRDRRPE